MRRTATFCLITLMLFPGFAARAQFQLSGEFRPRTEYRHGFASLMSPGEDAAFFISQRSRLNFSWQNAPLSFYFSLQDVRVWGEVPQLNRSDVNSSVHEAWGELALGEVSSIRLGRQQLVYDNSRILGNVDWAQQARSHDIALFKTTMGENSRLHAGLAFNQDRERLTSTFYILPNYKTIQFVWFNTQRENLNLSLLFLNNGVQFSTQRTVFSQTTGAFATLNTEAANLAGSFYLQTGRDASNRKLNAWYLAASATRPFNQNLSAALGFEILSGNHLEDVFSPAGTTNRAFTPLYGTNHAFNGHMDYFYVGSHLNSVGLINPYLQASCTRDRWSYTGVLHLFFSHGQIPDHSSYLGTEIDLFAGFTINPQATVRFGYSHMFASQTMEVLKDGSRGETNNWAWIMLVLRPILFTGP